MTAAACAHVSEVRDDWGSAAGAVCEDCQATGASWVSLRRCLTCGRVGCCDSSPDRHATAHHLETGHPVVRALQPGHDWVWCYPDEVALRRHQGAWVEVDLLYEAGLAYMREHVASGGTADVGPDGTVGEGFPIGRWVQDMRGRKAAGELDDEQVAALEQLPGWRWG